MVTSINSQINATANVINAAANFVKTSNNPTVALNSINNVLGSLASLVGSQTGNVSKNNPMPNMSELFGNNALAADNKKKQDEAKSLASGGGAPSLGKVLSMIGGILTGAIDGTLKQLQAAAKQLDVTSQSGGPTAAQNQKIQELTFNLQQIQQTLNRVNEAVTNLSKSQTDAAKATIQNLSV